MKNNKIVLFALALVFLASCGSRQNNSKKLTGTINIDGSSTVYPITEAVAEEFRAVQPDVKITVGISGSGGGFKKFSRGETDISNASRSIKKEESDAAKENNIDYIELAIAYDGLAIIINPENTWVDYFTVEELKKIWEPEAQGKIMRWNQIRPEWPNSEIHLFGPGIASGTFDYFTEAIVGKSGSSRGDFTASEDDNVLVQGIIGDQFALGFFGLAYYEENKDKLKLVGVHNGRKVVLPSLETVKNGSYTPLSRPLFIYVNKTSAAREEVKNFITFYLQHAAKLSAEVGYISLPNELYLEAQNKFTAAISE